MTTDLRRVAQAAIHAYWDRFEVAGRGLVGPIDDAMLELRDSISAAPALPEPTTVVQRTAPERIWLQISDDADHFDKPFPRGVNAGITWCEDSVLACQVPYVRADLALPEPAPDVIERMKTAIEGECDGLAITNEHARAILQYVFPEPAVKAGWRWVPVEPTEAMRAAGFEAAEVDGKANGYATGNDARRAIYQAMCAAAPEVAETGAAEKKE